MAQVQVRDQNGNGVSGIAINLGRADEPGKRLFTQTVDPAGNTDFGYAAAGIIALNQLPKDQKWILYVNDVEAYNPNWNNIEKKQVLVDNFAHDVKISLQVNNPNPIPVCPDLNNKTAITNYFHKAASNVGVSINNVESRKKMIPEITPTCGWEWQNQRRGDTRARIYFPPLDSNGASGKYMNTGDEGQPFNLSFNF